jgi:putative CocE/NonD family hydrolase
VARRRPAFVHLRPDVLSWETGALTEDVTVTGRITARLFASTTGTDSDWVVKLIDVYPEDYPAEPTMGGYQLMVANEVFRGRFRKSFEKPEALVPGRVTDFTIDLHTADHRFLKGHKIMVQVQSTWFPLIDRNPQTYVENIFLAKASDYRPATQRVFRSKAHPSHLVLPVRVR